MKNIAILGSTGSIGRNALEIITGSKDSFRVSALTARSNIKTLARQIDIFKPKIVAVADSASAKKLRAMVDRKVQIRTGEKGFEEVAANSDTDLVLSAMVGSAGLLPTIAAIRAGKNIALANKETIVTAGELVMKEAKANKVKIIPVDSEHSAIFQALRGEKRKSVKAITLTASGGPFYKTAIAKLKSVTPEAALKHPNWEMGAKITIDSATMMNKGLEVIEARWLFNMAPDTIKTVVHPESVIHSMVEFCDRSIIAQLGFPDMKTPISFALAYPERMELDTKSLDLATMKKLTFSKPDTKKFPCLKLAYEALYHGQSAPAVLNAANEVAVESFLKKKIAFLDIPIVIEKTVSDFKHSSFSSIEEVLEIDSAARRLATNTCKTF